MPTKKTEGKKSATKTTTKKVSTPKVVETKKPTVIVETKKTDKCGCGDNCSCGDCCKCGLGLKFLIIILIIVNLIVSCFSLCSKKTNTSGRSAWDLEALKVGGYENLEKLEKDLYGTESYKQAQKESIEAYINQYGIE